MVPGAHWPLPGGLKELRGLIELIGLIDLIALIGLIGLTGRAHRPISQEINTSLDQKSLFRVFLRSNIYIYMYIIIWRCFMSDNLYYMSH